MLAVAKFHYINFSIALNMFIFLQKYALMDKDFLFIVDIGNYILTFSVECVYGPILLFL